MTHRYQQMLKLGLIVAILCTSGFLYLKAYTAYSWHFMWDMDLATVLDIIAIQSGMYPDHVNHPGFGMYLLLNMFISLASSTNILSAVNLDSLAGALNPLSCVAELTDFIRLASPTTCLLVALLLCAFFFISYKARLTTIALTLLAISTQQSFIFHSALNRTELYSILFWGMALFSLASAYNFSSRKVCTIWTLLAGCCLSLAILTKVQSFIYVLLAPSIALLIRHLLSQPILPSPLFSTRGGQRTFLILSIFNLLFFAGTLTLSRFEELPPGVWSFTEKYGLTSFGLLLLFIFIACPLVLFWVKSKNRHNSPLARLSIWVCILETGFLFAYLFHFLVLPSLSAGWKYLLVDLKMAFFRSPLYSPLSLTEYYNQLSIIARYAPSTLIMHFVALITLLYFGRTRLSNTTKLLCILATCAALACAILSSRPILRDILWFETIINILTISYCLSLSHLRLHRIRAVPAIILICITIGNIFMAADVGARLDARYHQYGWNPFMWQQFVFFGSHQKYKQLIWDRYGLTEETAKSTATPGLIQAAHHRETRRAAQFVFPGSPITLRQVGVASTGYPALANHLSLKISFLPPPLNGGIVVDPLANVQPPRDFLPIPPKGEVTAEWPLAPYDKDTSVLSVLPRADLTVWLVSDKQILDQVLGSDSTQQPLRIEMTDGLGTLELYGRRVTQYTKLPTAVLGKKSFFVITSRFTF